MVKFNFQNSEEYISAQNLDMVPGNNRTRNYKLDYK